MHIIVCTRLLLALTTIDRHGSGSVPLCLTPLWPYDDSTGFKPASLMGPELLDTKQLWLRQRSKAKWGIRSSLATLAPAAELPEDVKCSSRRRRWGNKQVGVAIASIWKYKRGQRLNAWLNTLFFTHFFYANFFYSHSETFVLPTTDYSLSIRAPVHSENLEEKRTLDKEILKKKHQGKPFFPLCLTSSAWPGRSMLSFPVLTSQTLSVLSLLPLTSSLLSADQATWYTDPTWPRSDIKYL